MGQTLDRLRIACQGTENTMPYIMECVMKETFGEYEELAVI